MPLPTENQRVKNVIKYASNGNILAFSREIGISQPRISRLFTVDKRNKKYPIVSFEIVQAIINKFENIDAKWLITGEGDMFKKKQVSSIEHNNNEVVQLLKDNKRLLEKENQRLERENSVLKKENEVLRKRIAKC